MILLKMNLNFKHINTNALRWILLPAALLTLFFSVKSWNYSTKKESTCPPPSGSVPMRVASASLAGDELLVRILKKAGAIDRLIATSRFSDDPLYSHITNEVTGVSARVGDNLEALASLKPDLVVFATFNRPAVTSALQRLAVQNCWLDAFESLEGIRGNILRLGAALGLEDAARNVADDFQAEVLSEVRTTRALAGANTVDAKPTVLSFDGSGTVMAGKTTFDDLVQLAGGINAASAAGLTGWPRITDEAISAMAPDVIVLLTDTRSADDLRSELQAKPGWRDTPAVKNSRFATPSPADLLALSPAALRAVPALRRAFYISNRRDALP